uniref:Uncharacterized protein n=1 Tax=uncultured marine virus TaxID=186617 RepID=A0A0F7LAV4_9VIRU|nr:hypothetical protein [uncultured marine virus]
MVKQSGIAFGQRTKQKGQSDLDQLISLKQFLRQRFHMDFKREWYVGFDREYGNLYRISESVGRQELERFRWKNPDLLCVDKQHGVIIVELDGAIHDRKVKKQRKEMTYLEEQESNLLSSILPILKSAKKQL